MKKRIGEFLVDRGVLTVSQVERILEHGRKTHLRFGESALDLQIISRQQMIEVFGPSFQTDFFNIEPAYYPEATRDLLSVELILSLGALPLGFKREAGFFRSKRLLNLGLLDPERGDSIDAVESIVRARLAENEPSFNSLAAGFGGTKVFLLLADQFLGIVRENYGVFEAELRTRESATLDPTLSMYLDGIPEERPVIRPGEVSR